jgi:protein AroM
MSAPVDVGIVYIGQSPRPSVEAELKPVLGDRVRLVPAGALDGLTRSEIEGLAPAAGEDMLFTRLSDDTPVKLAKRAVETRLAYQFALLRERGVSSVALACTGDFAGLAPSPRLLYPSRLLDRAVDAVAPARLAVLTPLDGLVPATTARWRARGYDEVTVVPLTPVDDAEAADAAGRLLAPVLPDLVVFDCISYNRQHRARVMAHVDAPALVAIDVLAHVMAALYA